MALVDDDQLVRTVESARLVGQDHPLAIGPITLRPRFNPNATGPEPETAPGDLPSKVDSRQMSLFGAGWTVGTLKALAKQGVYSLTYFETTGRLGVMEREKDPPLHRRFPAVFHGPFPGPAGVPLKRPTHGAPVSARVLPAPRHHCASVVLTGRQ